MAKRIITEADVHKAHAGGGSSISAPLGECIVTPKARDKALELGVSIIEGGGSCAAAPAGGAAKKASIKKDDLVGEVVAMMRTRLPAGVSPEKLETLVREVVGARVSGASLKTAPSSDREQRMAGESSETRGRSGVLFVDNERLLKTEAGMKPVPGSMIMAEALGAADQLQMSAGYMQWEKASFNRTMEYMEICIVIEGRLHLSVGGENLIGKPGDIFYLPKGAKVIYSTPDKVKLACVNCLG